MQTKLVVNIDARFEWSEPPKDKTEEYIRNQANIMAIETGKRLEQAVQLIILESLNKQPLTIPTDEEYK